MPKTPAQCEGLSDRNPSKSALNPGKSAVNPGTVPPKLPRTTIELPKALQTPAFEAAWNDWQAHRTELRKRLTPSTKRKQLAKLAQMGVTRAIAAIEHSIEAGYTGIFEPKQNGHAGTGSASDDDWDRVRAAVRKHHPELERDKIRKLLGERLFKAAAGLLCDIEAADQFTETKLRRQLTENLQTETHT